MHPTCTLPFGVLKCCSRYDTYNTVNVQVIVLALGQGSSQLEVPPFTSAIAQLIQESGPPKGASGCEALESVPRETMVPTSSFAEGACSPRDALFAETER